MLITTVTLLAIPLFMALAYAWGKQDGRQAVHVEQAEARLRELEASNKKLQEANRANY